MARDFIGALLVSVFVFGALGAQGDTLTPATLKAVKEAENLSLLKDRLPACTVLVRTIKKTNRAEAQILKEKLEQLSTYFYSDKGFQDYLAGKDFFEKQKFGDALDKLIEADDLENGNTLVLHLLSLAQLWSKKETLAQATIDRALQMNPYDVDLLRDDLAIKAAQENWADALKSAKALNSNSIDGDGVSLQNWGVALIKNDDQAQGMKMMAQANVKNKDLPEPYYWLGTQNPAEPDTKLIGRYIALCTQKIPHFEARDPKACIHLEAAQKTAGQQPKVEEKEVEKK